MNLSNESVQKYKALCKKHYAKNLNDDEARDGLERLLKMLKAVREK